ncbi:hypothetical protein AMAG_13779 [Allomyces macrogynus ATCC 38327]|uniref:Uncharacterized protein n=1 Tax=Allomyces macrogynus (strain ATCC 38327) TaxID=578462 RepID=A0A0L0T4C9_ALLM3|nr:hypothetical protein AMAG_13779 [Allomyces macrogynus ATCC 38327]|eukprot:KNE69419.1 hypothetical protein AMAG_13779 [Allomyces macrogynus ATCC 38327]
MDLFATVQRHDANLVALAAEWQSSPSYPLLVHLLFACQSVPAVVNHNCAQDATVNCIVQIAVYLQSAETEIVATMARTQQAVVTLQAQRAAVNATGPLMEPKVVDPDAVPTKTLVHTILQHLLYGTLPTLGHNAVSPRHNALLGAATAFVHHQYGVPVPFDMLLQHAHFPVVFAYLVCMRPHTARMHLTRLLDLYRGHANRAAIRPSVETCLLQLEVNGGKTAALMIAAQLAAHAVLPLVQVRLIAQYAAAEQADRLVRLVTTLFHRNYAATVQGLVQAPEIRTGLRVPVPPRLTEVLAALFMACLAHRPTEYDLATVTTIMRWNPAAVVLVYHAYQGSWGMLEAVMGDWLGVPGVLRIDHGSATTVHMRRLLQNKDDLVRAALTHPDAMNPMVVLELLRNGAMKMHGPALSEWVLAHLLVAEEATFVHVELIKAFVDFLLDNNPTTAPPLDAARLYAFLAPAPPTLPRTWIVGHALLLYYVLVYHARTGLAIMPTATDVVVSAARSWPRFPQTFLQSIPMAPITLAHLDAPIGLPLLQALPPEAAFLVTAAADGAASNPTSTTDWARTAAPPALDLVVDWLSAGNLAAWRAAFVAHPAAVAVLTVNYALALVTAATPGATPPSVSSRDNQQNCAAAKGVIQNFVNVMVSRHPPLAKHLLYPGFALDLVPLVVKIPAMHVILSDFVDPLERDPAFVLYFVASLMAEFPLQHTLDTAAQVLAPRLSVILKRSYDTSPDVAAAAVPATAPVPRVGDFRAAMGAAVQLHRAFPSLGGGLTKLMQETRARLVQLIAHGPAGAHRDAWNDQYAVLLDGVREMVAIADAELMHCAR